MNFGGKFLKIHIRPYTYIDINIKRLGNDSQVRKIKKKQLRYSKNVKNNKKGIPKQPMDMHLHPISFNKRPNISW